MKKRKMSPPFGIAIISSIATKCCPRIQFHRPLIYKASVLFLTYICYVCYHMTRKPIAVVKSVLHRNCTDLGPIPNGFQLTPGTNADTWCDYPPFDKDDANKLLGILDSAFLFSYAIAMFISGFIAERVSLRYFLSLGMLFSGVFCYMFGLAKTSDIHSFFYFFVVQALAGIFQTTGWPGVVTVMGRWYGKSKRGLIFGIWNSHTSVGNMLGTFIAAYYVDSDWSKSFIYPGLIMGIVGFILFMFLPDSPDSVGLQQEISGPLSSNREYRRISNDSDNESDVDDVTINDPSIPNEQDSNNPSLRSLRGSVNSIQNRNRLTGLHENQYETSHFNERTPILGSASTSSSLNRSSDTAVGFMGALKIPGVVEFSLCLFFSKLVNYTFLFWLPLYIKNSTPLSPERSAELSVVFDIGGIVGAILTGLISDSTGMPATTCVGMLFVAAPLLLIYEYYGALYLTLNIALLFIVGLFVNGPYALITTSVSAELGQHKSLEGNSKALATVTAIIDGTGSIGAAVGPLIAGLVQNSGWNGVFYMLIGSNIIAMILLSRLVVKEYRKCKRRFVRNVRIE